MNKVYFVYVDIDREDGFMSMIFHGSNYETAKKVAQEQQHKAIILQAAVVYSNYDEVPEVTVFEPIIRKVKNENSSME